MIHQSTIGRSAFLPMCFCVMAIGAYADIHTAASCSQTDVKNAVTAAGDWDTVKVPAGNAIWTVAGGMPGFYGYQVALCVTKGITLRGGIGGTTAITLSGTASYGIFQYFPGPATTANNVPFELTGFTFDGNGESWPGMFSIRNENASVVQTNIKIHDNVFKNNLGSAVTINGPVYGVIYSNTFTDCNYTFSAYGYDKVGWALASPLEYGTKNNLFVEDNTINYTYDAGGGSGETTTGQGALGIVFRYNTYNLLNATAEEIHDIHGLQSMATASGFNCPGGCGYSNCTPSPVGSCDGAVHSCQQWSTVKSEYYGNIYTNVSNSAYEWMGHRGSWLMMFNNNLRGGGNPPIYIKQYSCDLCQSPATPAYSQHIQNTYIWNNTTNGTRKDMVKDADYCADNVTGSPYTITPNRDYWNYNPNTLNGSTQRGINCGPDVPTCPCSPGDGYWQTSNSPCSTPPATMDDMKKFTQAGKFYKCNAQGAWELYYRPYTYPHPLRGSPANAIHPKGTRTVSRNATIQVLGTTFTIALPCAASIRSPELSVFDISGRMIFHVALGAMSKKATAEDAAIYEYMWHRPLIPGTYFAIVKEAAYNGASVMTRAKIVVGRQ